MCKVLVFYKFVFYIGTSPGDANDDNESDNSQETEITDENKPPEPSSSESSSQEEINEIEQEQNDILETMDADANVLRQRRLNFYENKQEKTNGTELFAIFNLHC